MIARARRDEDEKKKVEKLMRQRPYTPERIYLYVCVWRNNYEVKNDDI